MRQVKPAHIFVVSPIIGFSLVIFFLALADAVMSYMAPVLVEKTLNDPVLVGLVLSISSFLGMALDLLIAERFAHKSFKFFLTKALFFAVLFPISFLIFPAKFQFFVISMFIWSVYYEFIGYSKYNFVHKYVHLKDHTNAWSTLVTFGSLAYMIGPGIAVLLIQKFTDLPLYAAIVLIAFSSILYFLLERSTSKKRTERTLVINEKRSLLKELGILKTLIRRLWILVLFSLTTTLMDVLMWTIGVLYTEELRKTSFMGDWLLVVYGLPALFTGLLASKLKTDIGKKKTAFTVAASAGLCLVFSGLSTNVSLILVFVFLMSAFYGISVILIDSAFQDYVARANVVGNDIVSILQFAHNVSYSFGPILLGVAAKYLGFGRTFQLVGVIVVVVSALSFLLIPRKIKMPQNEIRSVIWGIKHFGKRFKSP